LATLLPHIALRIYAGEEWVDFVGRHNSGTYNNQYMLLDLKRFRPGKAIEPGDPRTCPGRLLA
jgi:hypothetical protein